MMIATVIFLCQTALAVNGAAELAAPDHQRVLEHAARLEILE